jgi:hypothetical protein
MTYVIKNITDEDIEIDGVDVPPDTQYDVETLTPDMINAHQLNKLQIKDATETLEERRADIAAMGPLDLK